MKKTKVVLILFIAIIFYVFYIRNINSENKFNNGDSMTSWFDWKIKHLDTQDQKEVVAYFEKINPVFNEANSTVWLPESSPPKYPDPKKALEIVGDSLDEIKGIAPPQICANHHTLTIDILENIKDYLGVRINLEDGAFEEKIQKDKAFETKIRNAQLERLRLEEKRQKEYFKILRKVGFYDKMTEEAFKLKLITEEEKKQLEVEGTVLLVPPHKHKK